VTSGAIAARAFDEAFSKELENLAATWPTRRASLPAILWRCQERWGWISQAHIEAIACLLRLSPAQVEGVVSCGRTYRVAQPNKPEVAACTGLSCHLQGASEVLATLRRRAAANAAFAVREAACLGRCDQGPAVRINRSPATSALGERFRRELADLEEAEDDREP
jgi:NADH:ubiquinone oxidoreductase subunit E